MYPEIPESVTFAPPLVGLQSIKSRISSAFKSIVKNWEYFCVPLIFPAANTWVAVIINPATITSTLKKSFDIFVEKKFIMLYLV